MALVATGCGLGDGEAVGSWCRNEVVASVDDPEGTMRLVRVRPGGEVTEIAVEWPDEPIVLSENDRTWTQFAGVDDPRLGDGERPGRPA